MGKKKDDKTSSFLSEEDEKLWRKIASSATPLSDKDRNRIDSIEITAPSANQSPKTQKKKTAGSLADLKKTTSLVKPDQTPKKQKPPLADIDRKKVRKIATDQIDIQATLDLHGYRQEQAHTALKNFIRTSQAKDFRYVLIITGKGSPGKSAGKGFWTDPEPGVLKRNVPLWLSDPDLRDYIVGYTKAHSRHGGEGALYVQLRRIKKTKP